METAVVILSVGLLVFLAHFFTALFDRTRIPDVLPLLLLGVLLGPSLKLVTPDDFGKVGGVFTTVALVIILFQSGLGLRFSDLKSSLGSSWALTASNYALALAGIGFLAKLLLPISWLEALILGSILGGTSSAVVIPLVGRIRLGAPTRTALVLESGFSDVLTIVGTIALIQIGLDPGLRLSTVGGQIVLSFLAAAVIGAVGALLWSLVLHRVRRLENGTFTTPAFVFILYGLAEISGFSGAIAALAFGMVLGNCASLPWIGRWTVKPVQLNQTETAFFAEAVFLLKTFFFVYIGLSLRFDGFLWALYGLLLAGTLFVGRIGVAWLSIPHAAGVRDVSVAAVMNPKGLAAAVLAGMPLAAGLAGGESIQSVVYSVILFSIIGTSLLVFLLDRPWLKGVYGVIFKSWSPDTTPDKG
jgi:NhaP-type Na+/H+ or K+/H+ antiporter